MLALKTYFYMKLETELKFSHPNGRPYWVLDYYKNSLTVLNSDGVLTDVKGPFFYLIPPNTETKHISPDGKPWIHTTFTFDAEKNYMDSLNIPYMTPLTNMDINDCEQLMFDMESKHLSNSRLKHEALNAYLLLILIQLHDTLNVYKKDYTVEQGDDLSSVRHNIMNSTHIPWTLERMATMANMSVRSFQRIYKDIYGISPVADLYNFRFTKAKRLLEDGFSINHIIQSCGFKSPQHFSVFFKKRAGITPSEYKKAKQDRLS